MSEILTCRGLCKNFGKNKALCGLNFTLESGVFAGVFGQCSGKTTLLKLAAGLLRPTSGFASVCGVRAGQKSKSLTAYLPDRNFLLDNMTVSKAVDFFVDFYEDFDENLALEYIGAIGINPEIRFGQMSKSVKQQLEFSLVMSRRAKLYLLDEPLNSLDLKIRVCILQKAFENVDENSAVLLSAQSEEDFQDILEQAFVLKCGTVLEQKTFSPKIIVG